MFTDCRQIYNILMIWLWGGGQGHKSMAHIFLYLFFFSFLAFCLQTHDTAVTTGNWERQYTEIITNIIGGYWTFSIACKVTYCMSIHSKVVSDFSISILKGSCVCQSIFEMFLPTVAQFRQKWHCVFLACGTYSHSSANWAPDNHVGDGLETWVGYFLYSNQSPPPLFKVQMLPASPADNRLLLVTALRNLQVEPPP